MNPPPNNPEPTDPTQGGERIRVNVLVVEDSEDDTLFALDALRTGGFEPSSERVGSAAEMRNALVRRNWDLILSDYRLPEFNALEAFAIYREFGLDIPFLIVSGVIGEETAVGAMKAGVHDYVSKNNLARLAPAVRRELREAQSRRDRASAEAALTAAYAELAAIHANVPALLLVVDEELRVHSANDLTARLSGVKPADVRGLLTGMIIGCVNHLGNPLGCGFGPRCPPCKIRLTVLDTLANGTRHENVEAWIPALVNGVQQERCLLVSSSLLGSGLPKKALVCAQDVTELKQTQVALDRRVQEIQTLFREVQHRVKNNLQVISSLLSLQAEQSRSEEARTVLSESRDRVRSMALIHEQLSHSDHMAEIDFSQYVERLASYLQDSYVVDRDRIRVYTNVNATLTLDQAVPCGLIVQELISNTLKHAFPNPKLGEIHIEFRKTNGEFHLQYRDNGVGLPAGFDISKMESLGMLLISDLTAQLRGELAYFTSGGANFSHSCPRQFLTDQGREPSYN